VRTSDDCQSRRTVPESSNSKHKLCYRSRVIQEIEIWRVAVLMINRYADKAEANIASGVPRSFARSASLGALRRS
jgi:hypothetical protein